MMLSGFTAGSIELFTRHGQALYTKQGLGFSTMKPTITERLDTMKRELGLEQDIELGNLAGASKSVVNQWRSGKIKSIAATYAYKLEERTGFCAKWIQLGEGPQRLSKAIIHTVETMKVMEPDQQYLVARLADEVAKPQSKEGNGQ